MQRRQSKREMADTIKLLLETPMGSGPTRDIEDVQSLEELASCNVSVGTRILMKKAVAAMKGDDKAAHFLFEYGGLKPVEDKHVSVDLPVFIDDLTSMEMRPPDLRKPEVPVIDIVPEIREIEAPKGSEEVQTTVPSPRPRGRPRKTESVISNPEKTIHANPIMGTTIQKRKVDSADLPDWIDTI